MAKTKKVKQNIQLIAFVVSILLLTAGIFYYANRPRFVRYAGFGIDLPVNYQVHGIDVSHHQSGIDWEEVRGMRVKDVRIAFSFIKATEGEWDVDEKFSRNWRAAAENGLPRGAYHYFNPYRSGKTQAKNFISRVKLKKGDLPPVLDVEQISIAGKADLQQKVTEWLQAVEAAYKVKPIIYTGANFYTRNLGGKFDAYPLWVAHYLVKDKPRVKRPWNFWQHSEAGHVNGIVGYVDFNVFNGDSSDFANILIK